MRVIFLCLTLGIGLALGDGLPPPPPPPPPPPAPASEAYPKIEQLKPQNPYDIAGDEIDKGGAASKSCRYDDPPWSDCDPFEMIRFRTLHLVHGGRQCDEYKNITKHCSPYELPPGTKWLIAEHRKCIAEFKRLKGLIADLSKYIGVLREKGQNLFQSYLGLKKHLEDLRAKISGLERENIHQEETIKKLRDSVEEWKTKARELQTQLDDIKAKFHDLQKEHKEGGIKLAECRSEKAKCKAETDRLKRKLYSIEAENSELKRRLLDAERYKDQLREAKYVITKLEFKMEKLQERLEFVKDELDQTKIDYLNAKNLQDEHYGKDTHMDLDLDMWITHNKTKVYYTTYKYTYPTTYYPAKYYPGKCLISYYGITNETCWYDSKTESAEADYTDTLGKHLVEAHWKYFVIDVRDNYECDKATHLHYEFLLNRCKPKHYLPVLGVFRPSSKEKELNTMIYPKPNIPQPGSYNRCWVTFLGPHGHCERRMEKYPLFNSDDTPEGYKMGSGVNKRKCLERAENWANYCENPVMVTYIPEMVSTNWKEDDIVIDKHGGRMFEQLINLRKMINPESYNPARVHRPNLEPPVEYEDTPEFRKSLNMKGAEREAILKKLRDRLGMVQPKQRVGPAINPNVKWHGAAGEHAGQPPRKDLAMVTVEPRLSAIDVHA